MERWRFGDPALVYERIEAQERRRQERSREGRQERAREGIESLFGEAVSTEPLFTSAHAAIVFALNYNHQQYDKPLMNRLSWGSMPQGKGLSGIDGAAQAGMIRGMIGRLSDLECAMLIAYCAPKQIPIPGSHQSTVLVDNKQVRVPRWSVNPEYQRAVHQIAGTHKIHTLASVDHMSYREVKLACVARSLGDSVNLKNVSERYEIPYRTLKRCHAAVRDYLLGRRGPDGGEAEIGAIQQAMNRAEGLLRENHVID